MPSSPPPHPAPQKLREMLKDHPGHITRLKQALNRLIEKLIPPSPPPPPVPQKLREMLKDYPEHIARLQEVLDQYVQKPFRLMPFDGAIWSLEGQLEAFYAEASAELQAAEASGNTKRIAEAKKKEFAVGYARANMWMPDLRAYFDNHKKAFE